MDVKRLVHFHAKPGKGTSVLELRIEREGEDAGFADTFVRDGDVEIPIDIASAAA
jgi:hypothetical protein